MLKLIISSVYSLAIYINTNFMISKIIVNSYNYYYVISINECADDNLFPVFVFITPSSTGLYFEGT